MTILLFQVMLHLNLHWRGIFTYRLKIILEIPGSVKRLAFNRQFISSNCDFDIMLHVWRCLLQLPVSFITPFLQQGLHIKIQAPTDGDQVVLASFIFWHQF